MIDAALPEMLAGLLRRQLEPISAVIVRFATNLKHEVASLVVDFGDAGPVIVSNFALVPQDHDTARSEPQKVLGVVFANDLMQVDAIHV